MESLDASGTSFTSVSLHAYQLPFAFRMVAV
jgi:hypothetical protein